MSFDGFEGFPKIERYEKANAIITEKIDGTNACIIFDEEGHVWVQSRKRMLGIGKDNDNFGFAGWVEANRLSLFSQLGVGRHFGEWYGCGIQRGYDMRERCFAPFNTGRFNWFDYANFPDTWFTEGVVPTPILWQGSLTDLNAGVESVMDSLASEGSRVIGGTGFLSEGCMIWSRPTGYLKAPFDPLPKGRLNAQAA